MSDGGAAADGGRRSGRVPLSLAPMLKLTDRHFRYLLRLVTVRTLLYSEMITAQAVLHGDLERLLGRHEVDAPVALQLGGDDPAKLAEAARLGVEFGYTEVNLNVGCPSERVQSGNFGACLMAEPELVADCLLAMREAVPVPVTVKHRIGIDDADSYADMARFVQVVAAAGGGGPVADAFVVHARKAWLKGLSPKENRNVPPLRYEEVYRLKRDYPELVVEINGGVGSLEESRRHLQHVDGVMIGRAFYHDPFDFAGADDLIAEYAAAEVADGLRSGAALPATRRGVVEAVAPYLEGHLAGGGSVHAVTKHLLGLFRGAPGGKAWRRTLTEGAHGPGAGPELIVRALGCLPSEVLDAPLRGRTEELEAA